MMARDDLRVGSIWMLASPSHGTDKVGLPLKLNSGRPPFAVSAEAMSLEMSLPANGPRALGEGPSQGQVL